MAITIDNTRLIGDFVMTIITKEKRKEDNKWQNHKNQ